LLDGAHRAHILYVFAVARVSVSRVVFARAGKQGMDIRRSVLVADFTTRGTLRHGVSLVDIRTHLVGVVAVVSREKV